MDILLDTTPVAALPLTIPLERGRALLLLPGTDPGILALRDEQRNLSRVLADMLLDIVWCCNLDEQALVIGSEDGHHVYVVDLQTLEVTQTITVLHEEDKAWKKFAILVTPDGAHVAIVSERKFVILAWDGRVVMEQRLLLNEFLESLENSSITFYDSSDDVNVVYPFPGTPATRPGEDAHALASDRGAAGSVRPRRLPVVVPPHIEGDGRVLQVIWTLPEDQQNAPGSEHKSVGEFFLRTPAGDFPCTGWKENPIDAITFLIATTLSAAHPRNRVPSFYPLGPYYLEMGVPVSGIVTLQFNRSYLPGALERLPPVHLPLVEYYHILIESGQAMLDESRSLGVGTQRELGYVERNIGLLQSKMPTDESTGQQ